MKRETIDKLVSDALAIEAEDARKAGQLGFMARALVQATLPHKPTTDLHHQRRNGAYRMTMTATDPDIGLPYGSIPRLLLAWLNTEAVRTRDRHLELGDSLSAFLRKLDLVPYGGRWGTTTRVREQSRRLFATVVSCVFDDDRKTSARFTLADSDDLWWSPTHPEQGSLWPSSVTLSERFYEEIVAAPVPIDLRALSALKRSPMALDIYCWTTYRMHTVRRPTVISWAGLQAQFGAGYPDTPQGLRDFRKMFLKHLRSVLVVYPEAKVDPVENGLQLSPSPTHVTRRPKRLLKT